MRLKRVALLFDLCSVVWYNIEVKNTYKEILYQH